MPQRACLVLGCGRSGTSMVAGMLSNAGYDLGPRLLAPSVANPRGFFEDTETIGINEDLLAPWTQKMGRPWLTGRSTTRPLADGERWLATLPSTLRVQADAAVTERIRQVTSVTPFCRKDPRYCYTLPAWLPYLANPLLVCVFRNPAATANSMRALAAANYTDIEFTFADALATWTCMYRAVLRQHCAAGEWLFLHYDDALRGRTLARLERALDVSLDPSFADASLRRSPAAGAVSATASELYRELLALSR
jgi:hypothetical protein